VLATVNGDIFFTEMFTVYAFVII